MLLKLLTLLSLILLGSASNQCPPLLQDLTGNGCIATCPDFSQSNTVQCVCDGGFQVSTDGLSCECQTGYLDIARVSCVPGCPPHSSPQGKKCECNSPFTSDGTNCGCGGGQVINLNGDGCISTCPVRTTVVSGQCDCNGTFKKSANGEMCVCITGFLDLDGNYCITNGQCPAGSSDIGEGVCRCDNGLFGNSCDSCPYFQSFDLAKCWTSCPARSTGSMGVCSCDSGYNPSGDFCICTNGLYIDTDEVNCVGSCSAGATPNNEGICECPNGFSGAACDFCSTEKLGIDGSCVASCPDYSEEDLVGNCQCKGNLVPSGNSCICGGAEFINVDGANCVTECPEHSSEDSNGVCQCNSPFVESLGGCICDNGENINLDGSGCIANCPSNSSPENGQCKCDKNSLPYGKGLNGNSCLGSCDGGSVANLGGTACISSCPARSENSGGQCVCKGAFKISADGESCECQAPDDKITVDGQTCKDSCPENSSLINGQCVCKDTFDMSGQECVCDIGQVLNLDGETCVTECPQGSQAVNGQCQCKSVFSRSGNNCVCSTAGQKINVDISGCVSQCPTYSFEYDNQCFCYSGFQKNGNSCECPSGQVVNLAGTGCLTDCPEYSEPQNGICTCFATFTKAGDGNSCECNPPNYISIDKTSCGSGCGSHTSFRGQQCTCNDGFVEVGNNCQCDIDKVLNIIGDDCIDDCPRGAHDVSGQCQCYSSFYGNGNGCDCPAGIPIVSVDGTDCISLCPDYSWDNNGQCVCNGDLMPNGNACGCSSSGMKINLSGHGCLSDCPDHSSDQGGQCKCDSPFIREPVLQLSCQCPNSLRLSLDGLNCIDPCPDHSIIVSNMCFCDAASGFVLSADKQSCECQAGMAYDSISGSCLVACSTLSPPNNVYPNCFECDATCKTCLGPNSNECLTCYSERSFDSGTGRCLRPCSSLNPPKNVPPFCYVCDGTCKTCSGPNMNECLTCNSGYQLSETNTCKVVSKTASVSTPKSKSVEVAKTTKTMSSASLAASSVASVGNSGAIRVSLVGNMFQYLKFLNISYAEDLVDMLENLSSQFLPFEVDVGIPDSMTDESRYKSLPYQFTKYEEIHPAFLVNFWDDLLILVVVIGIVGVLVGLQLIVNKFYKEKAMWKFVFSKASLMAQSFLLTFTYNDLGNIIFFGLLDFKSSKSYSGVHVLNLIIAISFLLAEVGILILHYTLLMKYRRIKRAKLNPNRTKEIEEFLEKHENLKAFFEDFNDFSFVQQCFLLVAIFRDMLCNLILVTLYQYPLAESTCFMVFSLLMIVYILYSGPFKDILNAIQQILCEGILLLVNTSVFINAVLDHIGSNDDDLRKKLGSIVVISNTVFNFVPMAFLAIALWQFSKELFIYIKGWMNKRKMSIKKEDLSLKSDVNNSSKVILRDLSLEGSSFIGIVEENKNTRGIIQQQQHKFSDDLELSQDQMTNMESRMMSKDNSGIFEVQLDQGNDELILDNLKEKSPYWSNKNGIRKVKLKRRKVPSQIILNERNIAVEGNDVRKK